MNRFYFTNKDNPEKTCYEVLGMVMLATGLAEKRFGAIEQVSSLAIGYKNERVRKNRTLSIWGLVKISKSYVNRRR